MLWSTNFNLFCNARNLDSLMLMQHTPKGNSWKWERKLYGQVHQLSPIYSLNLFLEFAYTF
jgi:hypothetical protein